MKRNLALVVLTAVVAQLVVATTLVGQITRKENIIRQIETNLAICIPR